MKKHITHIVNLTFLYFLSACSSTIMPSEEADNVTVYDSIESLPAYCLNIKTITGLGSSELEARYDLAHKAKVEYASDTVLLNDIKTFHQTTRLHNYRRTPELKAPKGTVKYYYDDAFTVKATGQALQCKLKKH